MTVSAEPQKSINSAPYRRISNMMHSQNFMEAVLWESIVISLSLWDVTAPRNDHDYFLSLITHSDELQAHSRDSSWGLSHPTTFC